MIFEEVKEEKEKYRIKEARIESQDGVNVLRFTPGKANYFLIVVHLHHKEYTPAAVQEIINKEYENNDSGFLKGEYKIYFDNKKTVFYCIPEAIFTKNRRTFKINSIDINNDIPYRIEVYAADVVEEDGKKRFIAYLPDEKSAYTASIPVNVLCVGELGHKGLLKKTHFEKIMFRSHPEDYNDGEFEYTVVGMSGVNIPITKEALRSTMTVTLDDAYKVDIHETESVKGIYKIEEK